MNINKLKKNKKAIFISLVVLVILGFITFLYYRGTIFSKEILKLEILGQENAKMGDEIEYTVKYKNNGNFVLERPEIIFELPDNSLTEDSKLRFTQNLEDIYPGQEGSLQFKGRLLGEEGDLKVAKALLSYTPKKLSARYESKTTLATKISAVPIVLTYDISSKIEKGKEFNYSINYFSNIDYPLENLSLRIDQLKGFNVKKSQPISLDGSEWKLETLNKGQGGRIIINGLIASDAENYLSFKARLGMWQDGVFVVFKETTQDIETIQIAKIELSQKVYYSAQYGIKNSGPIPIKVGESTTFLVKWQINNYSKDVKNLKVKAILPKNVLLGDNIFPEEQANNFSFDTKSREIVWLTGDLLQGSFAELTFQIAIIPDQSQQGRLATLVNQATVFGEDQITGVVVQDSALAVDSSLPDDQNNSGGGIVQ